MAILQVYIPDEDKLELDKIAEQTGREAEELASAAVSEAILGYSKK